jgi:predicted N-formylglutamate amidohydrolase
MTGSRAAGEPTVDVLGPDASGPFLIVCEHASRYIPDAFGDLGLAGPALSSHVAWDPGALAVAEEMARLLDAPLVAQRVSRLIYDCNRPPDDASAVPVRSEIYDIPRNAGLTPAQLQERVARYYEPFKAVLTQAIDAQTVRSGPPALVTVHSFTPVYFGAHREVEIGILHDADSRLADAMLRAARNASFVVRRNEPYGPKDGVTHTLKEHALPRGLLNVMLEIRNDLIATAEAQREWAGRIAAWLKAALVSLQVDDGRGVAREASR